MFIAHVPAGYLVSSLMAGERRNRSSLVGFGLFCSALPDFDLLWFYLVDNRQTAHHEYMFHWPLFWIALAIVAWLVASLLKIPALRPYIAIGIACLLTHMLLDSFASEIYWFRPLSDVHLNFVNVPALYGWWVWNFVLHWTFFAEVVICVLAGWLVLHRRRASVSPVTPSRNGRQQT